ncbi:MAG: hypothetical protein Q8M94_11610, partial [Ignavibacteria bacterium]|nr:hypothetical protein [Ignavibacteria bacterium]
MLNVTNTINAHYQSPIPLLIEPVYEKTSKYQDICLGKFDNNYILTLNGDIQFIYPYERSYHSALIGNAIRLLGRQPGRVLILGGGDGMAARDAIKHGAKEVVVVELDKEMIRLFRNYPIAAKLNNYAFHNKNAKVIINDAYKTPYMGLGGFDLIAVDLTDKTPLSKHLYSLNYMKSLIGMLNHGGVLSGYNQTELSKVSNIKPFRSNIPYMGTFNIHYYK